MITCLNECEELHQSITRKMNSSWGKAKHEKEVSAQTPEENQMTYASPEHQVNLLA